MDFANRKNHRLKDYDYGKQGYYFITICTKERKKLFCNIVGSDALVVPTELGEKVLESFLKIETLNENVFIDKFVLMPNHIHAIIKLQNDDTFDLKEKKYGFEISERRGRRSLQGVIKDFKSVTSRIYCKMYNINSSLWQESFYDEIIRNQKHYLIVWEYIDTNPSK